MREHVGLELTHRNTFALPSVAEHALEPTTVEEVQRSIERCLARGWRVEVLGEGSNVVLQEWMQGCLVVPRLEWIRVDESGSEVRVCAGAGVRWNDLVRFCIAQGLHGLENLVLIPGRVGAAPMQNIGAYGVEMESRFDHLLAVSCRDARLVRFERVDCEFGYRDSVFKREGPERFIVVEVAFVLDRRFSAVTDYPDVREELARGGKVVSAVSVADAIARIRRRKLPDPRRVPNAGSFFANPVVDAATLDAIRGAIGTVPSFPAPEGIKISAARLIDACGWKGRRIGRAGVWPRQPLVLVNLGQARATDVLALADAIVDDVGSRFGVRLEREPRLIGVSRPG
jgi:UDP-N-acetylmuramate dehydrogenase